MGTHQMNNNITQSLFREHLNPYKHVEYISVIVGAMKALDITPIIICKFNPRATVWPFD